MNKTNELKTMDGLKHLVEREERTPDYEAVDLLTLKAEAVRDYKRIEKENRPVSNEIVLKYIKEKNNLTDEDLKEQENEISSK